MWVVDIKENKRIVGCRLYEPIKTIEIEQQQEEVIKDDVEVAENDDLTNTEKIIIGTIIGIPTFLGFFIMVIFIKEILFILAVLLYFAIPSILSLIGSAIRYCFVREVYDTYKGKK